MYLQSLFIRSFAFTCFLSAHAAPQPVTSDEADDSVIANVGTYSILPSRPLNKPQPQNLTTAILSSDPTVNGTSSEDFSNGEWHEIDGLEIVIDQVQSAIFDEQKLIETLDEAKAQAIEHSSQQAKLQRPFRYEKPENDAAFSISPTVSRVLTWDDVSIIITGLTEFYTQKNKFQELTFAVDELRSRGDRGRFAQGSVRRLRPTPPHL